jgi:hypothetical protein
VSGSAIYRPSFTIYSPAKMGDNETQKYIEQIKEGWNQLSTSLVQQAKGTSHSAESRNYFPNLVPDYTGIGGDKKPDFIPTSMMGSSDEDAAKKARGIKIVFVQF